MVGLPSTTTRTMLTALAGALATAAPVVGQVLHEPDGRALDVALRPDGGAVLVPVTNLFDGFTVERVPVDGGPAVTIVLAPPPFDATPPYFTDLVAISPNARFVAGTDGTSGAVWDLNAPGAPITLSNVAGGETFAEVVPAAVANDGTAVGFLGEGDLGTGRAPARWSADGAAALFDTPVTDCFQDFLGQAHDVTADGAAAVGGVCREDPFLPTLEPRRWDDGLAGHALADGPGIADAIAPSGAYTVGRRTLTGQPFIGWWDADEAFTLFALTTNLPRVVTDDGWIAGGGNTFEFETSGWLYHVDWPLPSPVALVDDAYEDTVGAPPDDPLLDVTGMVSTGAFIVVVVQRFDDDPLVVRLDLAPPCPGDFDESGAIDFGDLLLLLTNWGPCNAPCPWDLDPDGDVGFGDLLVILASWGPCD